MTTDAMVDIETLDTSTSGVILSVGAVKFDPYHTGKEPHSKTVWLLNIEEQLEKDRTVSDATLQWWLKQDPEIFERAIKDTNRVPVIDFMKEFNKYLAGVNSLWAHHPHFDIAFLENIYKQYEMHMNWKHYRVEDSATTLNRMPYDIRKDLPQQDLHDAGEDAYWQAVSVQVVFKYFGYKPR